MKTFILTAVKYFVLLTVLFFLGSLFSGGGFDFNPAANATVSVLCAFAELEVRHMKENGFSNQ